VELAHHFNAAAGLLHRRKAYRSGMKNQIVADGYRRFLRGKKAVLSESVEEKYAAELAKADPHQKLQIRQRMVEEYLHRKEIEGHKPSAATLW